MFEERCWQQSWRRTPGCVGLRELLTQKVREEFFFQRSLDIRLRLENVPSGGVNEVSRGGYVFSGKKCFYSSKGGGFNDNLYP